MNEFQERKVKLKWHDPKKTYDVIIIGGGGHGLSTAYFLATRHNITNVAVIERKYIGGGNSGRNTTIIRADYGIPEAMKFYGRSVDLYYELEKETDRWLMFKPKGMLRLIHSEANLTSSIKRAHVNSEWGHQTDILSAAEVAKMVPELDMTGGGKYPVIAGFLHHEGATARHDRVNWALAEGANRLGTHIHQRTEVLDLIMSEDGSKVKGVRTNKGDMYADQVLCAVGGHVTKVTSMAGLRMPIRTHPLQAFVTNHYERNFDPIIASLTLHFYVSQTARGEMLMGAHVDRQPAYNYRAGYDFIQHCAHHAMTMLPFMRKLRVLRQWTGLCDMSPDASPILGLTPVDGFHISTGWGTWGFKAIPASGESLAKTIATGEQAELIQPFALDRFAKDRAMGDLGSTGTH